MKTNQADKWFSLFIRLRDSDENGYVKCCTCSRIKYFKDVDCGHFRKRQHMATRYSEINCNAQCKGCNCFEQGANEKYAEFIKSKYGQQKYDLLFVTGAVKHSAFELKEIAKYYQKKAIELAKEKGVQL